MANTNKSYRSVAGLKSLAAAAANLFVNAPLYHDENTSDVAVEWTAVPALQNAWANVAASQAAQYRVYATGVVSLRGNIDTGTKTAGTLITTLPVGARPAAKQTFPVLSEVAAGVSSTLVIDTDGTVKVGIVTLTTACAISLIGVSFDVNA